MSDMVMDGFVLGPGPAGRCDDYRVGGAVVHRADDGWLMWYYCRDRAFDRPAPGTLGSGRIALATSADGIAWSRVDGPGELGSVFVPSDDPDDFDAVHVGLTDISRRDGRWEMWYFGGGNEIRASKTALGDVRGLGMRPGLAISDDGINWQRERGPLANGALLDFDAERLYTGWPNVFDDGEVRFLQLTTPTLDLGQMRTDTFTSTDGLNWAPLGYLEWEDGARPWDVNGIVTRQVLENPLPGGRRWLLLYTGLDDAHRRSIGLADSDDGRCWNHVYDDPIFGTGAENSWDALGVAATRLVPADGRLFLYYYGFTSLADDDSPRGIGLAIADNLAEPVFRRVIGSATSTGSEN